MNILYGDEYAKQRAAIILEVFEILTMIGIVYKDEIIAALAEMK